MSEREPKEKERSEAEALARALEGDKSVEGVPVDALETAALLRSSLPEAELSPERSEQILAEIIKGRAPEITVARTASGWLRWLVPVGAAAGVLLAVLLVPMSYRSSAPALPAPSLCELLLAQAKAARGEGLGDLERGMRAYRGRMLAKLAEKYREAP